MYVKCGRFHFKEAAGKKKKRLELSNSKRGNGIGKYSIKSEEMGTEEP